MKEKQHEPYVALKCYDCRTINVFPKHKSDGNKCNVCGGLLEPIGDAIVGVDLGRGKDFTAYPPVKNFAF